MVHPTRHGNFGNTPRFQECNLQYEVRNRAGIQYLLRARGGGDTQFALVCIRAIPRTSIELVWEDSSDEIMV